jgi:hypothetical protein
MHRCGAACSHPQWAGYGSKARPPLPLRPDPTAPLARLERRYPLLVKRLAERTARSDPQRTLVYSWEEIMWHGAGVANDPVLDSAGANAYCARIWEQHSGRFRPWFVGVPLIQVMADNSIVGARAQALHHRVLIDQRHCTRPWLIHELAHLLLPERHHDSAWRDVVMRMWVDEIGIPLEHSTAEAVRMGLDVPSTRDI